MTIIQPMPEFRNLSNQFTQKRGKKEINFRNKSNDRDSVSEIEIRDDHQIVASFSVDVEDNVAMAVSILGIGRVTAEVEARAKNIAAACDDEDAQLETALVRLRAVMLIREKKAKASEKDLEDAFALYRLAYPKTTTTDIETFKVLSMKDHWISVLRTMRKDPTVLGAL